MDYTKAVIIEKSETNSRKKLRYFENFGFSSEGETYCIFGKDTFSHKDELKGAGCRYSPELGWHIATPIELPAGLDMFRANFDDYYEWSYGKACPKPGAKKLYNAKLAELLPCEGKFIGDIKMRIRNVPVTITAIKEYCNDWGNKTIYSFVSEDGNFFTWFASRDYGVDVEDKILLTGTVIKHEAYCGKNINYVNRCVLQER